MVKRVHDLCGIKESDTGLAPPSRWDLVSDKQMMQEEHPLQVARCTKIINPGTDQSKYVINVKQIAKFVVGLGDKVAPTDVEEGMRVGVDRNKYQIQVRREGKFGEIWSACEVRLGIVNTTVILLLFLRLRMASLILFFNTMSNAFKFLNVVPCHPPHPPPRSPSPRASTPRSP